MAHTLITGMSATGKPTTIRQLVASEVYPLLHHIVLLTVPTDVAVRLANRSTNELMECYRDWGSRTVPRLGASADGGGTTGPMSPSGASSKSTITGAWSLGPVPLRA
jgi:hypothetical protein